MPALLGYAKSFLTFFLRFFKAARGKASYGRRCAAVLFLLLCLSSVTPISVLAVDESLERLQPAISHNQPVATPRFTQALDLKPFDVLFVRSLAFSPDSRFLAILASSSNAASSIIVWDMERRKPQSIIRCTYDFATWPNMKPQWSKDGKVLFLGPQTRWNAMTGEAIDEIRPIIEPVRLSKDGSMFLGITGSIGAPSSIQIGDTRTWSTLQRVHLNGMAAGVAFWTADNKIVVTATPTRESLGKEIDGRIVRNFDVALRLIDPTGKEQTKSIWFPAKSTGNAKKPYLFGFEVRDDGITNFRSNEIFLGSGRIINGRTLALRNYRNFDKNDIAPGAFGMALSPDGSLLYLKGATFSDANRAPIENSIVDTKSGQPLLSFKGAMKSLGGLAASPDGQNLAFGDLSSVLIFHN